MEKMGGSSETDEAPRSPKGSKGPPSPSFVLDLSGGNGQAQGEDRQDRFLLGYTADDGSLDSLAVVCRNGVYTGDKTCIEKPAAKKRQSAQEHLSKVKDNLVTIAASASRAMATSKFPSAPVEGATGGAATLPLSITASEAVLTIKEAVKGGASFVVLATVRLPLVQEACAGLLLGVVRATFDKEKEAALRKTEADRANQELSRFNRLLDTAINDKRKVMHRLLEKATLVLNSKKAMIANLAEQQSGDENESENGERSTSDSDEDEAVSCRSSDSDTNGASRAATTRGQRNNGKGPASALSPEKGSSRKAGRGGAAGKSVRVKAEPGIKEEPGGGDGWAESVGALAIPSGTQEVSGEDLFSHVVGDSRPGQGTKRPTVKAELLVAALDGRNGKDGAEGRDLPLKGISTLDISSASGGKDRAARFPDEALRHIGGDSDGSEGKAGAGRMTSPRRRRKKRRKPDVPTVQEEEEKRGNEGVGSDRGGGGGDGGGSVDGSGRDRGLRGDATMDVGQGSKGPGAAEVDDAQTKDKKKSKPRDIAALCEDDDWDLDDMD